MPIILHISDCQFGSLCMAKPTDPNKPESINNDPLIVQFFSTVQKWPKPDAITLTGDVTTRAAPVEFLQAEAFLSRLSMHWGGEAIPTFMVPGNHDVSWDISKLDGAEAPGFRGMRFAPYLLATENLDGETRCAHKLKPSESSHFVHSLLIPQAGLLITGINSAVEEDHDASPHHGYVAPKQLEMLEAILESTHADYRIVALHHHLRPLKDPPKWRDYSTATNAQALTDLLGKHKIDLVIHGHRHCPNYDVAVSSTWMTHVFGAGSLATVPTERGGGDIHCSAHLINIENRDGGIAYGEIRTIRLYGSSGAWSWKTQEDEFPSLKRFGRIITPQELDQLVVGVVSVLPKHGGRIGQALAGLTALRGVALDEIKHAASKHLGSAGLTLGESSRDLHDWVAYPTLP
ncbi:metallophosphoesterase [Aggregicoccus sp. 17bor-14]|uniref:metallophosphoesterase family protein n=1 Tax=Myxococcaceae TaxID=31 RepID=UPI00129CA86F|nr:MULTISPECIES: metallophosphoesterase [Myxococcaceae]MBF5044996.1 metallophosphoesterase [Simulacricoccus sp. 17bor-14]MRI90739.1 metallophosphoesterase [Aggregicoccus sp. 17bor-14]